jgi:hypothetical protein
MKNKFPRVKIPQLTCFYRMEIRQIYSDYILLPFWKRWIVSLLNQKEKYLSYRIDLICPNFQNKFKKNDYFMMGRHQFKTISIEEKLIHISTIVKDLSIFILDITHIHYSHSLNIYKK